MSYSLERCKIKLPHRNNICTWRSDIEFEKDE